MDDLEHKAREAVAQYEREAMARATRALMTGPKSTLPKWRTMRKLALALLYHKIGTGEWPPLRVNPITGYRWGP